MCITQNPEITSFMFLIFLGNVIDKNRLIIDFENFLYIVRNISDFENTLCSSYHVLNRMIFQRPINFPQVIPILLSQDLNMSVHARRHSFCFHYHVRFTDYSHDAFTLMRLT